MVARERKILRAKKLKREESGSHLVFSALSMSSQSGEQVLVLVNFRNYARRSPKESEEAPIYIVQSEGTTNLNRKMKRNVFKF